MVYLGGAVRSFMLDMAAAAILNVGVKSGGLLAEFSRSGGVASDAGFCFNATRRRVTRFAVVGEKGVLGRERSGLEKPRPTRDPCRP